MRSSRKTKVLSGLIVWRLISVFVVQTAHVPDEYWQSVEVAHRLAFGYGYLTWEWKEQIRNYTYPFLISILYRVLSIFSLDYATILTTVPRILQAVVTAYAEYKFYEWNESKWTLYSLCINWYWYYCATRTLINTVETACTMIALSMFPWRDSNVRTVEYLWIIGFLCMIRPTAAVVWSPLCLYHLLTSSQNKFVLICKYSAICATCCLCSILLDSYCYGSLVVSPWAFFRANVVYRIGDFYGTQHLLWYIFCGLPVVLGCHFVVLLPRIWQITRHPSTFHREAVMLVSISWTVFVYSLLSHKEFRFLLPLLPMCIYICTSRSSRFNTKFVKVGWRRIVVGLLIATNALPGLYFSLVHQRGSLDVMNVLHEEIVNNNHNTSNILFLTPCHATPLYSHLHVNVSVDVLTCQPNFSNDRNYVDEADRFFANPTEWLDENYNEPANYPAYVVLFDNIVQKISEFLTNYRPISKVFYAHFPQSNYGNYIHVYRRN